MTVPGPSPVLSGDPAPRCPYDPAADEELRDPYPTLSELRNLAPVIYVPELDRYLVTRQAEVLEVIRDVEHFSNAVAMPVPEPPAEVAHRFPLRNGRRVYPSALTPLVLDGDEHRRARAVIQAPFTPRALSARQPMIREISERLLAGRADDVIDLVGDYALPFALQVVCGIVGIDEGDLPLILAGIDGVFALNGMALVEPTEVVAAAEHVAEYWEFLLELAERRLAEPMDDFASVIAREQAGGGLTEEALEQIAIHLHSLIAPGFETTAQAITHGLHALLTDRPQWERLGADRGQLDRAVMEMLRYRTVAKLLFRQALDDVRLGGIDIPSGAVLALSLASANRDERVYELPETFDMTREADNLAFGRWKHFCVGAALAKLELRITLETLLDQYPGVHVVTGQSLRWRRDSRIDALQTLLVDLAPANSNAAKA